MFHATTQETSNYFQNVKLISIQLLEILGTVIHGSLNSE